MKNNIKLTVSLAKLNFGTQVQLNRPYPYFDTYTKQMKREKTGMRRRRQITEYCLESTEEMRTDSVTDETRKSKLRQFGLLIDE